MDMLPPFSILILSLSLTALGRTQHPCYFGPDQLASDNLLPCYSTTYSDQYSCCIVGDVCLEHNACYNANTGITYQYACTDPTFQDESCPKKCGLDTKKSPWVGLVFCDGTNSTPNDTWVCNHPDNCGGKGDCADRVWDTGLENLGRTSCGDLKHGEEYVAFCESSTLSDVVDLPTPPKLSSWWTEHADRVKSTVMSIPILHATTTANGTPGPKYPESITPSPTSTTTSTITSTLAIHTTSPSQSLESAEIPASKRSALCVSLSLGLGIPIFFCLICTGIHFHVKHKRRLRRASRSSSVRNDHEKQYTHHPDSPHEPTHELEGSSPTSERSELPSPTPAIDFHRPEPAFQPAYRELDEQAYLDTQHTQLFKQSPQAYQQVYNQMPYGHPYCAPHLQLYCSEHPKPYSSFTDMDMDILERDQERDAGGEQIKIYLEDPYPQAHIRSPREHNVSAGYGQ